MVLFGAIGWVQKLLVPSQMSNRHGLPSSVQAVPAAFLASVGHVAAVPVQNSTASHSPAALRHTVEEEANVQFAVQQTLPEMPGSHCSPTTVSITPLPHKALKVTVTKWPSFACVREGLPGYPQTSQSVVDPFCSPSRTAASHEFERTFAVQENVSVWLFVTPLLTP